jgi:MYXO-CTERM domain-containing protein
VTELSAFVDGHQILGPDSASSSLFTLRVDCSSPSGWDDICGFGTRMVPEGLHRVEIRGHVLGEPQDPPPSELMVPLSCKDPLGANPSASAPPDTSSPAPSDGGAPAAGVAGAAGGGCSVGPAPGSAGASPLLLALLLLRRHARRVDVRRSCLSGSKIVN